MKTLTVLILGMAALVLTQCKASAPKETPETSTATKAAAATLSEVTELSTPAAAGSGEPNLSTSPDGHVYLSWLETEKGMSSMRFSVLGENQAWSPAGTIAQGEHWFVNSADYPSMMTLPDGTLAAHWLADNAAGSEAYNVHVSFSRDGGKTWGKPIIPHHDRSMNEHGFVTLVASGPSELGVLWLDGNKIKDDTGDMALAYTTIGIDGKLGKEATLDGRVCECCQTSAVVTPNGILAVYRDRTEKEIRDISIVRSTKDGWSQPESLSKDNWMIDGCPVNGPSVSYADSARGGNAAVAWFTGANDGAVVNVVLSNDGGKTFGAPIKVDNGKPVGRVDVSALSSGGALVTWVEQSDAGTQVRIRQVQPGGGLNDSIVVSAKSSASFMGVPRMTRSGNQVVVAWTDKDSPAKVHTAVLKLN